MIRANLKCANLVAIRVNFGANLVINRTNLANFGANLVANLA